MARSGSEIPRIRDILSGVGRRLGVEDAVVAGEMWKRWPEIAGPEIARHAEPTSLKRGVLRVRTRSPVWATELGYLGPQIAARANEILGVRAVLEVKVWTGPEEIRASGTSASAPVRGRAGGTRRGRADDPKSAFERARAAWSRRRAASDSKAGRK